MKICTLTSAGDTSGTTRFTRPVLTGLGYKIGWREGVGIAASLKVFTGVGVTEGMLGDVRVAVPVGVGEFVKVPVSVKVGDKVALKVEVGEKVKTGVLLGENVEEGVAVGVTEGE